MKSEKESRRRGGEEMDRARLCRLKDCGEDIQFILRGTEKAMDGAMPWSKRGAQSNLYSELFNWLLCATRLVEG